MKSKLVAFALAIGFPGSAVFVWYQICYFICFPGWRGAVYDTWELENKNFKVRLSASYEEGISMPGLFYTCESAEIGSKEWREFKDFRGDDAAPLRWLVERFRFVDEQTACLYTADDFSVTRDSGRTWSVWQPILPEPNGRQIYWAIMEASVEVGGKGRAKL